MYMSRGVPPSFPIIFEGRLNYKQALLHWNSILFYFTPLYLLITQSKRKDSEFLKNLLGVELEKKDKVRNLKLRAKYKRIENKRKEEEKRIQAQLLGEQKRREDKIMEELLKMKNLAL